MKSYTDINQSKKLAEILPFESADMHYSKDFDGSWFVDLAEYTSVKIPKYVGNVEEHLLPCWSLAALLDVLPDNYIDADDTVKRPSLMKPKDSRYMVIYSAFQYTSLCNNPVDACYEMILKLHELKML